MLAAFALLAPSCLRTPEDDMNISALPEGTPITMRIDFGASDLINLDVSTKAEATPADEERIHAGEFLRLLQELDPEECLLYKEGAEEVEEILEKLKTGK